MERESFIFYESYKRALDFLAEAERYPYLCAIIDYALCGVEPSVEGAARACFELVRPIVDANNIKYLNGCKGAEYGKLGGAPKGNQNARKTKTTPKQPQINPKTTPEEEVEEEVEVDVEEAGAAETRAPARGKRAAAEKAKKEFLKAFPLEMNGVDDRGVDYVRLLEAFNAGDDFLRDTKSMRYVVKHYAEILDGKYRKKQQPAQGLQKTVAQSWAEFDGWYEERRKQAQKQGLQCFCAKCSDTGWLPDGHMCDCYKCSD